MIDDTEDNFKYFNNKFTDISGILPIKRIHTKLRPFHLDELGFIEKLTCKTEEFEKKSGIKCELAE